MKKILIFIIVVLIITIIAAAGQITHLLNKYNIAMANIKSYNSELSLYKDKNVAYQLTIDQMKYFQDSILRELDNTRKSLKIKENKVKSIQYISSGFSRSDTLIIRDTIFKKPDFDMDTIIGDNWYHTDIKLKYPSTIAVSPTFKSEKHVIVSTKRETVNPPKKFFLFRWFQRKHTVIQVDVVEKNPYVINEKSKYIEIIK